MARTQFFKHGELPLVILALLAQEPLRGFDVMGELDRLFGPQYQASAGSVYPALSALREEGLVRRVDGPDKLHELTDSGREALHARRRMLAAIEDRTGARLGPGDDLTGVVDRFASRLLPLSGRVDAELVEKELDETWERIRRLAGPDRQGDAHE